MKEQIFKLGQQIEEMDADLLVQIVKLELGRRKLVVAKEDCDKMVELWMSGQGVSILLHDGEPAVIVPNMRERISFFLLEPELGRRFRAAVEALY